MSHAHEIIEDEGVSALHDLNDDAKQLKGQEEEEEDNNEDDDNYDDMNHENDND